LAAAAISAVHLSRLAEELVLWATEEFGFVELPDAFATGSSMMPQKKNPDVAELVRGKTGRVTGALVALLTMLKGLPLAYNRDLQEDKPPLFDAADTLRQSLDVMARMLPHLRFDTARMAAAADGLLLATDLADVLLALACALPACGRKSRPVAPELVEPETVENLAAIATPDGVRLSWLRPTRYTGGGRMNDLGSFEIERAPGEGAAPAFAKIGT